MYHRHPCNSLSTEKHEFSLRALESALLVWSGSFVAHVCLSADGSCSEQNQISICGLRLLFERAMLWDVMEIQRNPMELVKLKGSSKRLKRPQVLTPQKFQELIARLQDPYRTMVIVAMCSGMRVSEVLALRWEHIDFDSGAMLVQQGVVNGRIGKVKTEASNDYVPLDSAFSAILLEWKRDRSNGLVFPSPVTGGCYYAGVIQQQILKPTGRKIGLLNLGRHCFRHTYRSLLDETGAPIGVQQKLMRHSNRQWRFNRMWGCVGFDN